MQYATDPDQERPLLAYVTCPDSSIAERIATRLVTDHSAACVNIVPGLRSVYRWQGRVETDDECLLMIKTRQQRLDAIAACLDELHPDDLPELIAVDIRDGSPPYLDWVIRETR